MYAYVTMQHATLNASLLFLCMLISVGCGYRLHKERQVTSAMPADAVMQLSYNGDAPDSFKQAVKEAMETMAIKVVDEAQLATEQKVYSLHFFWQRQNIATALSAGNFAISVAVDAHYNLRTPTVEDEHKAVFLPNALYSVVADRWRMSYVQTQADAPRSAQYAFAAENSLFVDVTNTTLIQQLKIKLAHFIANTKDKTLGALSNGDNTGH